MGGVWMVLMVGNRKFRSGATIHELAKLPREQEHGKRRKPTLPTEIEQVLIAIWYPGEPPREICEPLDRWIYRNGDQTRTHSQPSYRTLRKRAYSGKLLRVRSRWFILADRSIVAR
jgi:hypothetical protein